MTEHIKIGAVPPRRHYIADGTQRAFAYPFPIFASEDMQVHLDAALQTGGYTVSGSGMTAGGTVTFDQAPDEGVQVTLLRRLPYERVTDFLESGALPARSLNDEYDYLTACVQQLADDALTMLHYAPTDLPASSLLPGRAARANQLLAFDGGGNPTVTPAIDSEGLSSFVGPGAGAVRRSIRDKLADIASVRDFGAVGDGIADDTLAIQTALTAATAVFVPPGIYRVTATLPVGYGQSFYGSGAGSIIRADGDDFPVILLPDSYASLHHLRIEQGMVGIKLTGRDGPCVQNAVHDIVVWDTETGVVLDGGDNPDRPCYWNNFARVLVVRHTLHGVHLVRTGAGDTPNANKFHCVRVYSLGVPSTGSGFYVQHGRFNNAFVDCEANLSTTAHTCFRIGPDTEKNLLVNLYTESVGGVPNVYLEAGSQETSITNLFSASGGPAIWDQSGGQFTAYNAGYPAKNYLKPTKVTDLTVEAMRYETRFVDPVAGGVVVPDMTRSVHLVSAFNGAVEFRLPAPGNAEGRALTIKKMDLSGNAGDGHRRCGVRAGRQAVSAGQPLRLRHRRFQRGGVVDHGRPYGARQCRLLRGRHPLRAGSEPQLLSGQRLWRPDRGEAAGAIRHDGGRPDRDDQEIRCQRQRGDRHPERRRRSRRRGHRAEREGPRGHRHVQRRRVAHPGPKSMKANP